MQPDHNDMLLRIYDTVAAPELWPAVLDQVADAIGARGCIVFELNGQGTERRITAPFCSASNDAALLEKYIGLFFEAELADQDVFEAHSAASDQVDLIDDSVLAENDHELLRKPNVQLLRRMGIGHRAACLLNKDNRLRGRFSVQLGADRGRLGIGERAIAAALMPHLAKAIELGRPAQQLAQEQQALVTAMDRLRIGVAILDRAGFVAFRNREFERQQQEYRMFINDPAGRLRLVEDRAQKRLSDMQASVLNHGWFGARPRKEAIVTGSDGVPGALCLEVVPLDRSEALSGKQWAGAVLFSLDTSLPAKPDEQLVRAVFSLTKTESELAGLIADGLTNREIADGRSRSVETVNVQVKSLLSKTQCANRTQLVRLLMSFSTDLLNGNAV